MSGKSQRRKANGVEKQRGNGDDSSHITVRIDKTFLTVALVVVGIALVVVNVDVIKRNIFGSESSANQAGDVQPPQAKPYTATTELIDILQAKAKKQHEKDLKTIKNLQDAIPVNDKRHQPFVEEEHHPDADIRKLPSDLSNWPYGEMGIGVNLMPEVMTPSEAAKRTDMYNNHAFEEYVSELISLNRTLPDWRGDWCRINYDLDLNEDRAKSLMEVSIIICFYNEAWSTLLRSVHSVINRSPPHLLREILLVDDASTMDHLGSRLDDYVKTNFDGKVKIIRQEKRQGLIRSRLLGIREASADVLVFLDSHIEAGIGWLEPLLFRIQEDPKLIIAPVIDAINDTSLNYRFISKDLYGLMNWRMEFEWYELTPEDRAKKPNIWAPHASPMMAGGLFAIRRDWFETLGYYDDGLEVWGGENLELSFKAWMCGGRIEIAPCSRVGHIFRTWSPYKVDTSNVNQNIIRVAEVWMDEFKYLYYDRLGKFDEPLEERLGNFGDVSERKKLRQNLKCKSFKWFLDSVATGLPYHPLVGAGEIRNPESDLCLDKNDRTEYMDQAVDVLPCHGLAGFQYWWMNKNRFLLRDYMCIGISPADKKTAVVTHCGRAGSWSYDPTAKRLKHSLSSGKCLAVQSTMESNGLSARAQLVQCKPNDPSQEWVFTRYKKSGLKYKELV